MSDTEIIVEPGRQDIVMRRVFDVPPDVLFRVFTDPQLVPNWWGPRRYRTTVEYAEVRPGGSWRFVSRGADGTEYAFRGVYHDVVAPDRIVQTFEYEGAPGRVQLETATFEEADGKTRYVSVSVFPSVEDRDGMAGTDMREGARESMDRLAQIIEGR